MPFRKSTSSRVSKPALPRGVKRGRLNSAEIARERTILRATGAQIISDMAGGVLDLGEICAQLLGFAREETGSVACGLFRTVQGTGLLVPIGLPAVASAHKAQSERLIGLMARAADQAATLLLEPGKTVSHTRAYRRRTTAQGGIVLWANVIIGAPLRSEESPDIPPSDKLPAANPAQFHPQVLGVWLTVSIATPLKDLASSDSTPAALGERDEKAIAASKRRFMDASLRVHPLFQLCLQQAILREAAVNARRQTDKRLREVAAIHDIGRAIDSIDIEELFQLITQKAADVMEAQACSLMLMSDTTDQMAIAAAHGLPDDVVENTRVLLGQGIAGRVAQTGEAMLIQSDARSDPRLKGARTVGLPGIASSITMPMFNERRQVRGVLCIRRRTPSPPFTEDDKRLFSIFATQAALAIKNARLYRELRSRVHELSTLASLTETISSTLDLGFVLNKVADSLIQLVGFDRCLLYLREEAPDHSGERYVLRVARGFAQQPEELPAPNELIREIGARLVPILMEEEDKSLPLAVEYGETMALSSFFAQPVIVRETAIGVLVVSNDVTHRPIAFSNLDLLSTFLQHAGLAIDNARLYAQMEQRVRELHSLYTLSQSLTTTYGLSRACATVARVARDVVQADGVMLMLFNDRLDTLRMRESQGLTGGLSDEARLLPDSSDVSAEARALREPLALKLSEHAGLFGQRWTELMTRLALSYPTLILVPLVTEDTAVGFLLLGRAQPEAAFRPDEAKLASIISSQAGAVLRGAALYEQSIDQRVLELSALYELSKKVRTARTLTGALGAILDIISSVIWCDVAEIYTVDHQRRMIVRKAYRGEPSNMDSMSFDDRCIPSWVLTERKALLIADVSNDPRFADFVPKELPCKSLMAIPVLLGDEVFAILQVQAAVSGVYNEDNVKMLSLIAAQAAALFRDVESLRELTSYTDNILRSIAAGVVTLDSQGCIVTLNQAAERILRVSFEEMNGEHFDTLLMRLQGESAYIEDIHKMVARAIETRQIVQCHRLKLFTGDSPNPAEPVIVNGSASQLLSEQGEYLGVVLVFEDITKEDEMEQELDRISRLAEIGQLAAGIAHELRNPLASIKGAAQVLLGDLSPELVERHGEFLDIIVREVDGLNSVTSEFLEFSRPAPLCFGVVSVNTLLGRRIGFMQAEFEQFNVKVVQDFDSELPDIQADVNQLERVFLNIILNAVQAMPEGGELKVSTLRGRQARDGDESGGTVEVRFADTGLGIPDSRREKIFTPFFTTKTKGTGLGLPIVQKIIDAHGGHIRVDSELGAGTVFTISLPVSSPYVDRFRVQSLPSAEISEQRLHAALLPLSRWTDGRGEAASEAE